MFLSVQTQPHAGSETTEVRSCGKYEDFQTHVILFSVIIRLEHGGCALMAAAPRPALAGGGLAAMKSANAVRTHSSSGTNYKV